MKRTARKLRLHADILRVLSAKDLAEPRGGFLTTILRTWCATCSESCTTGLDTT